MCSNVNSHVPEQYKTKLPAVWTAFWPTYFNLFRLLSLLPIVKLTN